MFPITPLLMKPPGRAFAFFKPKIQGPEISQKVREFSFHMPQLELRVTAPSMLSEDVALATLVHMYRSQGKSAVIKAKEMGVPSIIVAGELRAIVKLMGDLCDGEAEIVFKEGPNYWVI
jgi:hypothetical protein